MEKIDRLGWTEGFSFSAYGTLFGIRTNDTEVLPSLKNLVRSYDWPILEGGEVQSLFSLRVAPPARRGRKNFNLLYWGAGRLLRTLDLNEALSFFDDRLRSIAQQMSPNDVFVPGAIVSWNERHLVLPAQEDSGLNELVGALEQRGAETLSRNFFSISSSGELKGETGESLDEVNRPLMVFTEYSKRNKTLRARQISQGTSALLLFSSGVGAAYRPQKALTAIAAFTQKVPGLRGKRGEVGQAADYLLKKLF